MVGLAYFAAVLSMIGDWFRVISKKTKEEVCVQSYVTPEVMWVGGKKRKKKAEHKNFLQSRILCLHLFSMSWCVNHTYWDKAPCFVWRITFARGAQLLPALYTWPINAWTWFVYNKKSPRILLRSSLTVLQRRFPRNCTTAHQVHSPCEEKKIKIVDYTTLSHCSFML